MTPDKPNPRPMDQAEALRILRKRGEFLIVRIVRAQAKGKQLTYDMAERDAIRWVLAQYEPGLPLADPVGLPEELPSRK